MLAVVSRAGEVFASTSTWASARIRAAFNLDARIQAHVKIQCDGKPLLHYLEQVSFT